MNQKCKYCGKEFTASPYREKKYCSFECYLQTRRENPAKGGNWKGNKASAAAIHMWVERNYKAPNTCEECGCVPKPAKDGRRMIEWANISGEYKRDRSDWKCLCKSCHWFFDKTHNPMRHGKNFWNIGLVDNN